ncbi:amino acid ABC transporter permease [Candidimonas nitroreducens]|uniref:Amino acid ABC transporter permease n=1 Tax=Candidimonas nitroreducens TaxID=683354 RepID=A0A225M306_9BURK|nr:amino acid ABC transporter permease [Candidimonas nitroreducens]OWT55724.1 amino acid ABC transporter permease [Candidimonas nitroreducens]
MTSQQFMFLINGLWGTVILSVLTFLFGGLLGFLISLMKVSASGLLRAVASTYITVLQGIPLLVLMGVAFYGPSLFDITLDPLFAAVLALTLYASAYLADIWQGCIKSVPKPQWEAAECLGIGKTKRMFLVILPQALRISLPPTVGFMVQIVKNTSIASLVVGYAELAYNSKILNNSTFEPFLYFGLAALLYFVICYPLSVASRRMELQMKRN